LVQVYQDNPDPGIHGAAGWLLGQWHPTAGLKEPENESTTGRPEGNRKWYINRQGQTMVIVPQASRFGISEASERQRHQIKRVLAISAKEVTVEQFLKFDKDHWSDAQMFLGRSKRHQGDRVVPPSEGCPVNWVSWYKAAAYCNWLSKEEGIPKVQWCYEKNQKGEYAEGMKVAPNYEQLQGYRLPTEAEWEIACRAGAGTAFSFGEPEELLRKYAWARPNSVEKLHPTGLLKPNDWGIFDMHGNAWEWCQDRYMAVTNQGRKDATLPVIDDDQFTLRGGSYNSPLSSVRCAFRRPNETEDRDDNIGFRLARTLRAE
jgi:formylglycine-generating enzyme required for sulfatase activity